MISKRAQHATVCMQGDILKVGTDFVDAVSGTLQAQGALRTSARQNVTIAWVSTLDCVASERAIRRAVQMAGRTVTYFESQGIGA